jgi:hypothetical protein
MLRSLATGLCSLVTSVVVSTGPAGALSRTDFEAYWSFDDGLDPTADAVRDHAGRLTGSIRYAGTEPDAVAPSRGNRNALRNGERGFVAVADRDPAPLPLGAAVAIQLPVGVAGALDPAQVPVRPEVVLDPASTERPVGASPRGSTPPAGPVPQPPPPPAAPASRRP